MNIYAINNFRMPLRMNAGKPSIGTCNTTEDSLYTIYNHIFFLNLDISSIKDDTLITIIPIERHEIVNCM